jgi:putative NADPH-quinone reductase
MRVLVLYAHPVETSFCAAMYARVVETLRTHGHEVDDCDLYAEGFDPVLSREERLGYHDIPQNRVSVTSHVDRVMAAEAIVLVHPVWNYGLPAILKGYMDRVFLPGVSFRMENGVVQPNLTHIRRITTVCTYGGTHLRTWLMGDPPRKITMRLLRATAPNAKVRYHALYDMNRNDRATLEKFLDHVGRHLERF